MKKNCFVACALLAIAVNANAQLSKEVNKEEAAELAKPMVKPATTITDKGFTANWEKVEGAEGYSVSVYEKFVIDKADDYKLIDEDFNGITSGSLLSPLGGEENYVNFDDYGYAHSAGWSAYAFPTFVPSMVAGKVYSPYINLQNNNGRYRLILTTYSNNKDTILVESHGTGEKQIVKYEVSISGGGTGIFEKELEFENGCEDLFFSVINITAKPGMGDYLDRVRVIQHLEKGDIFYSLVAIDEKIDAQTPNGEDVTTKKFIDATKYASNDVRELYYTVQAGAYNFKPDENGGTTYHYVQSPKSDMVRVNLADKTSEIVTGINQPSTTMPEISSAIIYNLNGQRIDTPKHGIYIKNGKKIVIK